MRYPGRKTLVGPWQWLRAHQGTADAAVAVALFAVILLGSVAGADRYRLAPVGIALSALACASLALRRRAPWAVLAFTCAVSAVFIGLRPADGQIPVILAAAVALATVAARTDRPTTWATGLLHVRRPHRARHGLRPRPVVRPGQLRRLRLDRHGRGGR